MPDPTTTAAAHNIEHGSGVIKVTTPATAALSARSPIELDLADAMPVVVTDHHSYVEGTTK